LGDTPEKLLNDIALTWVVDDEIGLTSVTFKTPNGAVTIN
jgi:hypothetical protein